MAEAERQRGERLQIMLDPEELRVVDNFRFKTRMPSRAAAVRELLRRGLGAEGFSKATAGGKSTAYGVTFKTQTPRSTEPEMGCPSRAGDSRLRDSSLATAIACPRAASTRSNSSPSSSVTLSPLVRSKK